MVFLFFEDIQRTPSPGFAPCQSPSGGVPTAAQTAHRTPGTPPEYTNTPTAKKRRTTPHRTPHSVHPNHSTNTPQTEPQHRTRAAIQDYTLQQPGRSSRPQGSPNRDPQTAPQRAGTPPGCNGVAPQTEAAHSGAQAAQRATENAPSRSPERCALFIHFQQVGENHQRKNQNAK